MIDLLGIPVERSLFLFCLFSKGMSDGALSPRLVHLLPLLYVTEGDLGPRHPWLTSTPLDSPANLCRKGDCLFCMLVVHPLFFVEGLCVFVQGSEWARVKSKFTQLTLTMLMFGSKARTWPHCQFTSSQACGEEQDGHWPAETGQWHSLVLFGHSIHWRTY